MGDRRLRHAYNDAGAACVRRRREPISSAFSAAPNIAFPAPVLAITYAPAHNTLATPAIYKRNLAIERQLAGDGLIRAAYVGSHSSHLTEMIELNPAAYTPGSTLSTDGRRISAAMPASGRQARTLMPTITRCSSPCSGACPAG